jgi:arginine deiminase
MSKPTQFEAKLIEDEKFSKLVSEYVLKVYKYNEAHEEDKALRDQSATYTLTQLKTYCLRFLDMHSSICDTELHNAAMKWFDQNILSSNPRFFLDYEELRLHKELLSNYVGPIPKVPKSELVSGYAFDTGIKKE